MFLVKHRAAETRVKRNRRGRIGQPQAGDAGDQPLTRLPDGSLVWYVILCSACLIVSEAGWLADIVG